jgi:hypothetical protein
MVARRNTVWATPWRLSIEFPAVGYPCMGIEIQNKLGGFKFGF